MRQASPGRGSGSGDLSVLPDVGDGRVAGRVTLRGLPSCPTRTCAHRLVAVSTPPFSAAAVKSPRAARPSGPACAFEFPPFFAQDAVRGVGWPISNAPIGFAIKRL